MKYEITGLTPRYANAHALDEARISKKFCFFSPTRGEACTDIFSSFILYTSDFFSQKFIKTFKQ